MNAKEEWIAQTMESLDGLRRAESDPGTYEKVMSRIRPEGIRRMTLRPSVIWRVAAGLALLIGLNVFSMVWFNRPSGTSQSEAKTLANDYFSYIGTIKY